MKSDQMSIYYINLKVGVTDLTSTSGKAKGWQLGLTLGFVQLTSGSHKKRNLYTKSLKIVWNRVPEQSSLSTSSLKKGTSNYAISWIITEIAITKKLNYVIW